MPTCTPQRRNNRRNHQGQCAKGVQKVQAQNAELRRYASKGLTRHTRTPFQSASVPNASKCLRSGVLAKALRQISFFLLSSSCRPNEARSCHQTSQIHKDDVHMGRNHLPACVHEGFCECGCGRACMWVWGYARARVYSGIGAGDGSSLFTVVHDHSAVMNRGSAERGGPLAGSYRRIEDLLCDVALHSDPQALLSDRSKQQKSTIFTNNLCISHS